MKEKLIVVFSRNKDGKTANMFIDNYLLNESIPYVPSKAVDHRGCTLFFHAEENGLEWDDFELDEQTETPSEVERGFNHMFQDDVIANMITESNEQRRVQKRQYSSF